MKFLIEFVMCLCFRVSLASERTYRAAVVRGQRYDGNVETYLPLIRDAADAKVDVLVLPSPKVFSPVSAIDSSCGADNYDEWVGALSGASKQAGLYLVAHLLEKTRCQGSSELVRSNLIFDREGNVISEYRKPLNNVANCTSASEPTSFTTDFGVTFGVLMEEDLVLQEPRNLERLRNFVLTGTWSTDIPMLSASQFASSWAFVNGANLVSASGIFAGRTGAETGDDDLVYADLKKDGREDSSEVPPVVIAEPISFHAEDLSLYTIRPLDYTASTRGYTQTVCQGSFCCEFCVKSKLAGTDKNDEVNYGLAVYSGVREFGSHNIGARTCAVVICAGLYKRSCAIGSDHNNTITFERISISGNFTTDNVEYPIVLSASDVTSKQVQFRTTYRNSYKQVTLDVQNVEKILHFGVFGRVFAEDTERDIGVSLASNTPGYIISGDMDEFFDYLWIRLRILVFVISIYVLEML